MTDFVDVVEVNPILFVKQIVKQIHRGFYVQNSIAGYPVMGLPYQIRMFEAAEAPAVRNKMEDTIHTVVVEGYDVMLWLLDVQDMAVQGFDMSLTQAVVDNFKSITMIKAEPLKFELTPEETKAPVAKVKRAASKTKPTQGEQE
jgi:hypothetical protein